MTSSLRRLFIIRHGERLDNKNLQEFLATGTKRFHDSPLTETGVEQAKKCGHYLKTQRQLKLSETLFVASPLVRTVMTTDALLSCFDGEEGAKDSQHLNFFVSDGFLTWEKFLNEDMARGSNAPPNCIVPTPIHLPTEELIQNVSPTKLQHLPKGLTNMKFFTTKINNVPGVGEQFQEPSVPEVYQRWLATTKYWWKRTTREEEGETEKEEEGNLNNKKFSTLVIITHTDVARAIHGMLVGAENAADIPYCGVAELVPKEAEEGNSLVFSEIREAPFFVSPY